MSALKYKIDNYLKPETIAMFEATGVMTKKELEARNEVKWETYTKKIQIEEESPPTKIITSASAALSATSL